MMLCPICNKRFYESVSFVYWIRVRDEDSEESCVSCYECPTCHHTAPRNHFGTVEIEEVMV